MKRILGICVLLALLAVPGIAAKQGGGLVVARPAGDRGPLIAYDGNTGRRKYTLPAGMASADGELHFAAEPSGARTTVRAYHLSSGRTARAWSMKGPWRIGGVSPTGRWIAVTRIAGRGRTTVAIADTRRLRTVHILRLKGDFAVDALSTDGKRLFLVEHLYTLGPHRYRIRRYDLSRERLVADPVSAKGAEEIMAGLAWGGVASPDGRWLLTLYLNTARRSAFVHALDVDRSRPACIDLPSGGGRLAQLRDYTLTVSADGRTAFAANPALGVVAEIDLAKRRVTRRAAFAPAGSGWSRSALSRNGRTLYFSGGERLWAYDAAFGAVRGPYPAGGTVAGLGFSPDGRRLLAARMDGWVTVLDAATGRLARRIP